MPFAASSLSSNARSSSSPSRSTSTSTSSLSSTYSASVNRNSTSPIRPTIRQRTSSKSLTPTAAASLVGGIGQSTPSIVEHSETFAATTSGRRSDMPATKPAARNVAGGVVASLTEENNGESAGTPRSISTLSSRPPVTPLSSTPASDNNISRTDDHGERYDYTPSSTPPTPHGFYYPQPNSHPHLVQAKSHSPSHLPRHLLSHTLPNSALSASRRNSCDSDLSMAEEGEATPLLRSLARRSGGVSGTGMEGVYGEGEEQEQGESAWYEGPLFVAGVKLGLLFMVFTGLVVGTFWFAMPPVDPQDREIIKLPKSFADLQALNSLFEKYKRKYPLSLLSCGVVSYLFVQTFSLPGSMYISILFGAAYGMLWGLFLSCLCESVGSVFCYAVSATLAPPLLTIPFYRTRVETWRLKILGPPGSRVSWLDIASFLLVLRITPFPPHWVCNVVAPHLGIGVFLFWATCFIGIAPVSVIHVTIGSSLDSMTSADEMNVLSLRNVLGLVAVVVAVLIPVGLKRVFKKDLGALGGVEEGEEVLVRDAEVEVDAEGMGGYGATASTGIMAGAHYHAVDSGVVLAGPSGGDEDYHPDPARQGSTRGNAGKGKGQGQGKGRLEIIADIREEDEYEDAEQDGVAQSDGDQATPVALANTATATSGEKRVKQSGTSSYGAVPGQGAQGTVVSVRGL